MPGRMEDLLSFEEQFETPVEEKDVPALNRAALSSSAVSSEGDRKPAVHAHHPLEKPVKRKIARGRLALEARRAGLNGIIYPSVRHQGGTCFAILRPAAVQSVRQGDVWRLSWKGRPEPVVEGPVSS
mgnify:CR=1 FL=1